nr:hypothetical protein [Tanacetum cinerariifolium]
NGPTPHPQTTDPAPEGGAVPPPRNKRDEEFTEEDNINELAGIQAINILSHGLPRLYRIQTTKGIQREQGHRIVGIESAVIALTERVAELERDN